MTTPHSYFGRPYYGQTAYGDTITGNAFHTIAANLPDLLVEIDFANNPTSATRSWTDVTTDVRSLAYTRAGRDNELQRTAAGALAATLDNRSGNYDSTNTTGAYYPGVKRMRWIRVRARWNGITYSRWQGLVESWRQEWPESGKDATVTITATGPFKVLNLFDMQGLSFAAERTDQRVTNVLAAAGVASSAISTGASSIVAAGPFDAGSSGLSHLLQVEETENGLLFEDEQGNVAFQDRHYRLANSGSAVDTIGDGAGEIPYRTGEMDLDDPDIWNQVSVTPDGGAAQTASDAASQAAHYTRRLNRSSLSSSSVEAVSAAGYLLNLYADPSPRIPSVELLGVQATSKWPTILSAKNSQRFTWKRRAAAHTISQDVYVERVSDTIIPGNEWQVKLELSPVPTATTRWLLADTTYGRLTSTTRVAY